MCLRVPVLQRLRFQLGFAGAAHGLERIGGPVFIGVPNVREVALSLASKPTDLNS